MTQHLNDLEDIEEDDFLDSIEEDDFVFVMDKNGGLKTLLLPETYDESEMPGNVAAILNILGVTTISVATIH